MELLDVVPQTIGVVGCGTTGALVAAAFAASGHRVIVVETDRSRLDKALRELTECPASGPVSAHPTETGTVSGSLDVNDLAPADVIIEAVSESRDAKRATLRSVAAVVGSDTPLTTTTSAAVSQRHRSGPAAPRTGRRTALRRPPGHQPDR